MTTNPMTRDPEILERALTYLASMERDAPVRRSLLDTPHALADFALAEIRRAVAEELEALRSHALGLEPYDQYGLGCQVTERAWVRAIDARLAALREQTEHEQRACSPDGTSSARKGVQEGDGINNPGASPGKPTSDWELDARLWLMAEGATSSGAAARAPHYAAFARYAIAKRDHLAQGEQSCCDRAAQEMETKMDEELHAVRMEAQTLREANTSWDYTCQKLIGWIQWRQAWTGGNDPRDPSGTRWDICALRGDAPPRGFIGCTPPPGAATVAEPQQSARKLTAGAAGSTPAPGATYTGTTAGLSAEVPNGAGVSERTRLRDESPAGNVAAPALSDADVLVKAAEILRASGWREATPDELLSLAEKRRAASAPEPVDVFAAFQSWKLTRSPGVQLDRAARDWFSPLVEALKRIEDGSDDQLAVSIAGEALSALRQRAQEASK